MMYKKIIVGILAVSVAGAAVAAIAYASNAAGVEVQAAEVSPLANPGAAPQINQNSVGVQGTGPVAEGIEGEPYQISGTIIELDDFGMTVQLSSGESQYIELGPPDYWQSQDVDLVVGKIAFIDGSINEDQVHASTVILDDGQILTLRSEDGQPMWSGGVTNGQGQSAGAADGTHTLDPEAMVQADEWFTLTGAVLAFQGGSMTIATDNGEVISFQTGQPRFFSVQGVTFEIGDEVSVVGFYSGEQFSAGDITQLATGLRVMLRDPNGRPLWAGPGAGNGNSAGQKTDG